MCSQINKVVMRIQMAHNLSLSCQLSTSIANFYYTLLKEQGASCTNVTQDFPNKHCPSNVEMITVHS